MLSFHQLKQCCSTAKSAEVAMPWGYIDQWLGFASPVDITGLDGFAGQHRKASFGGELLHPIPDGCQLDPIFPQQTCFLANF